MPKLIDGGHVYLAVPPLFKLKQGALHAYARGELDRDVLLKKGLGGRGAIETQRFKGLGEMNAQELKDTTMDPRRRNLLRVQVVDGTRDSARDSVERLMGNKAEARFSFIQERAAFATDLVDI